MQRIHRPLVAGFVPVALLLAGIGLAGPAAGDDFTFRRVTVAPGGTGPRITVQIDPAEQARRIAPPGPDAAPSRQVAAAVPRDAAPTPASARFGWFWSSVPADLQAREGRFMLAMETLRSPPAQATPVPEPRLSHLQAIAARHGAAILHASIGTRVSPALALAVISVESAGRVDAVSRAGAQGLMQLIPATAARFAVTDAFDPAQNLRGGIAYLDWLLNEFGGDVVLALAGYNAGEGAVRRNGGVPPFAETRDYVPRVLAAWNVARGLCTTPIELPSDGCVFATGDSQDGRARAAALSAAD
ncbi:MAG: transglycosylase SLT domain-containing protein [Pararhodobacter sp.]|nr:transglycosylase SLT domain-containing protein [Pararhodobacter sp.]